MIPKIDAYIWVDTDADTCSQRIKMRGREGEDDIPLDYLKSLERVHQEWLCAAAAGVAEKTDKVTNVFRSQNKKDVEEFLIKLNNS